MAATQATDTAVKQANPDLRLQLDKVSLYAETNKLDAAYKLLDQLKAQYPENPQVLQAEADLNLRIGNQGAAFADLNKAVNLDPGNEDLLDRQREAMLGQGSFAAAGYRFRSTKEANEHFAHLSGQTAISNNMSVGLDVENDHLNTKTPITRENGVASNFSNDRQRGTVTLNKMYDNGNQATGALYANNDTIGAGAHYAMWDHYGATGIYANLRKPEWDYVETVIEDGTKDNIRIERKQIITTDVQATLGGGFNNYNLRHDNSAARAGAWDLNLAYTHPYSFTGNSSDAVTFGAYYTADAEYFTHVDKRVAGGVQFRPLPASSYEVHAINLSASKSVLSNLFLEGYGGYAYDRIGGKNGPLFGGAVEFVPVKNVGLELRGFRTMLGGQRNNEKEDQIGLNLKVRW